MQTFYLGIDVAKAKLDCALQMPNGKLRHKVVDNKPAGFQLLAQWLAQHATGPVHACMEATGTYWEAAAEFLAQTMTVSVVNPAKIKAFAASRLVRSKTDRIDAQLIAQYCAQHHPDPWQAPSPNEQALRAMVLRLESLQTMRTQELNRLEVARDSVKPGIAKHLAWLDCEIKSLAKQIRDHIDGDPQLKSKSELLDTIPGVGERTIATLLSFYADLRRFDNARQAVAFAGLDPRHHESGSSVKDKPRLSKVGHRFLRKALYMPAVVALHRTTWGKLFRDRLTAAGKPPMLIIGAMMRKLVHVAFGVMKSAKPFEPALHHC